MDELVRASLQQVEIDAQVILYLEMTQVRCSLTRPAAALALAGNLSGGEASCKFRCFKF